MIKLAEDLGFDTGGDSVQLRQFNDYHKEARPELCIGSFIRFSALRSWIFVSGTS